MDKVSALRKYFGLDGFRPGQERLIDDILSGRDCTEVLVQLAAVRSALNNTAKVILKDHVEHCLADAVECGDMKALEQLNRAIEQFMS